MTIARWPPRGLVVSRSHSNSAIAFGCENGAGSASTIRLLGFDANRKPDITIQLGAHPTMSGEVGQNCEALRAPDFQCSSLALLKKDRGEMKLHYPHWREGMNPCTCSAQYAMIIKSSANV